MQSMKNSECLCSIARPFSDVPARLLMLTISRTKPSNGPLVRLFAFCLLSVCVLIAGCSTRTSGNALFSVPTEPFSEYRQSLAGWLEQHSMPQRSAADIELNLPFERKADPAVPFRGVYLLFHGLNDSPYVWHDLSDELTQRGFDVRAVLLEGHGSSPVQMLDVSMRSWLDTAYAHFDALRAEGATVHIGGFSMGAVLATLIARDHPEVASLLLISPAYESRLNHYLKYSGIYRLYRPWLFGGMILEDNPIKYNSIPINSGWQFYKLSRHLKRSWRRRDSLAMPVLLVVTVEDSVVDVDYTEALFKKRFTHPDRLMIKYTGDAARLTQSTDTPHVEVRSAAFPEHRIVSQSHLGLMYAPDNALFGKDGSVLVCNGNEYPVFIACLRARQHWYGAQHAASPDGVPVARTTWNPDWDAVLNRFDERVMRHLQK